MWSFSLQGLCYIKSTKPYYRNGVKILAVYKSIFFAQCYIRWFRIFPTSKCQGIVKATVSGVFEDLNWDSQQGRLRTTSILVRAFWNFKRKVLKYSRNCSLHNTLIPNLVKPYIYKGMTLKYIYRTRAIVSHGLYTFLPHFQRPFM